MTKIIAFLMGIVTSILVVLLAPSVEIDFSNQSDMTGRASGYLYGLAEEDIPSAEIVESVGINTLATKPAGGLQHPIGDVNEVSGTFNEAGGEYLFIYTQDMYDTWYYQFDSLEAYNERVRKTVTEMENSDYRDKLVYCIYNEMDNGAWFGTHWEEANRYKFYDAWLSTYNVVKEINPDALIAGPGHCGYNAYWIEEFLSYCIKNDCVPDMMVWHELNDQSVYRMETYFEEYYTICDRLGIDRLPICISEYGMMSTNGIPGESVKWITRLENHDVYGCVAYWRLANNLADTVSDDVTPNSNYWVYNFYAQMNGVQLDVTENDILHSNIENYLKGKDPLMNKGFIALASYNESQNKICVLAGGGETDCTIKIKNIDKSAFKTGEKVTIKVSYVDYKGLGGEVVSPEDCFVTTDRVMFGNLSFKIPCERASQSYFIEITPYNGEEKSVNRDRTVRYEAEDALLSGNAYPTNAIAYACSQGNVVKGIDKDSSVEYTVKVDEKGRYKLDFLYGNSATANGRSKADVKITINGEEQLIKFPSSIKEDYIECVTLFADLKKGKNVIKIEVESDNTLTLDCLDIDKYDESYFTYFDELESRNANPDDNDYYAVVDEDGYYKLSLSDKCDTITINGITAQCNFDSVYYLHRGYNKIIFDDNVIMTDVEAVEKDDYAVITPKDMTISGGATLENNDNTSSGKHIGYISSETGSRASFIFDAPKSGYYNFTIEYANNEEGGFHAYNVDLIERYITFTVNGENRGNHFFRSTYAWDNYKTRTVVLYLEKGENEITLSNDGSYSFNNRVTYAPNIGSIVSNPF